MQSGVSHFLGPAGMSVACHLFLVGIMAVATWAVVRPEAAEPFLTEYKAKVVTDAKKAGPRGGFRFPGRAFKDRPDSARASHESDTIHDLASLLDSEAVFKPAPIDPGGSGLGTLTVKELSRSDVVGIGDGGGVGKGGRGSGLGDRDLAGGGPVGTLWGVGEGQLAKSIVYVMDRSGSMAPTFSLLQRELMRAIGSLDSEQLFNVIWFNEGPATQLADRMLAATIENKRDAFAAIKRIIPSGQTEPVDAVRQGLTYKPDVLFLLSDGDFGEDNERIVKLINQKNKHRTSIINTILFVYDTEGDGERVLRAIADANGGTFKHVTEQDIRE
ncbi:MAG TPA: hypothetical protein VMV94_04810 [Phycisphaerae bacterium]|nr:hypothetical protein [Phycisphaerae bacterium]